MLPVNLSPRCLMAVKSSIAFSSTNWEFYVVLKMFSSVCNGSPQKLQQTCDHGNFRRVCNVFSIFFPENKFFSTDQQNTTNFVLSINCYQQPEELLFQLNVPYEAGVDPGRAIVPPKIYESDLIHHNFAQFGKQHSRYNAIVVYCFVITVL